MLSSVDFLKNISLYPRILVNLLHSYWSLPWINTSTIYMCVFFSSTFFCKLFLKWNSWRKKCICDGRNDCQTWGGGLSGSMTIKLGEGALAAEGEGSFWKADQCRFWGWTNLKLERKSCMREAIPHQKRNFWKDFKWPLILAKNIANHSAKFWRLHFL